MPHSQGLPGSNDDAFSYSNLGLGPGVRYLAGACRDVRRERVAPVRGFRRGGRGGGKPGRGVVGGMDAASPEAPVLTVALDMAVSSRSRRSGVDHQDLQFVMDVLQAGLLTELALPEEDRDAVVPQALLVVRFGGLRSLLRQGQAVRAGD